MNRLFQHTFCSKVQKPVVGCVTTIAFCFLRQNLQEIP